MTQASKQTPKQRIDILEAENAQMRAALFSLLGSTLRTYPESMQNTGDLGQAIKHARAALQSDAGMKLLAENAVMYEALYLCAQLFIDLIHQDSMDDRADIQHAYDVARARVNRHDKPLDHVHALVNAARGVVHTSTQDHDGRYRTREQYMDTLADAPAEMTTLEPLDIELV